jgi:hypothetical protein
MNQLSLHYVNQADREREIAQELRNRRILDMARATTISAQPSQSAQARSSAADLRPTPVRARAAGR